MQTDNAPRIRATAGEMQGFGATPREALDALLSRQRTEAAGPIVIWPFNNGDAFFTDAQQARLQDLKRRSATLTDEERIEWEALVEAAFDATSTRTKALSSVKT